MGGHSPIPLSSSSCSHNAVGQECKRQLRPHSSAAAAAEGLLSCGGTRLSKESRNQKHHTWSLGGRGADTRSRLPEPQAGSLAFLGAALQHTPPTSPGNSGALVPLSNLHAYPR